MKGLTPDELTVLTAGPVELPGRYWEAARALQAAGRATIRELPEEFCVEVFPTPAGNEAVRLHRIACNISGPWT